MAITAGYGALRCVGEERFQHLQACELAIAPRALPAITAESEQVPSSARATTCAAASNVSVLFSSHKQRAMIRGELDAVPGTGIHIIHWEPDRWLRLRRLSEDVSKLVSTKSQEHLLRF